ncbi:MAG: RHS repeat-associated core domain-containing protein [Pseudomonadota bacterium]
MWRATLGIRVYIWLNGLGVGVWEEGQLFYVRSDHTGRPVFATNDLGLKVWEGEGRLGRASSGRPSAPNDLPFGGVQGSFGPNIGLRFPGQWFQSESGLHQNWMRDYDPTTGRYLQGDPLGLVDGASVYGYALQNPGRYVDPRGEQSFTGRGGGMSLPGGAMSMPEASDYVDFGQTLLDLSHQYNPIDLFFQWCFAGEDDCAEQWREAYATCAKLLSQPNPSRKLTGGHTSIHACARGFVSERCKGNPVDWGPEGPPPGWKPG